MDKQELANKLKIEAVEVWESKKRADKSKKKLSTLLTRKRRQEKKAELKILKAARRKID